MTTDKNEILCPSSICESGASILGVIDESGSLRRVSPLLPVTDEFVSLFRSSGSSDKFRFVGGCRAQECSRWVSGACAIAIAMREGNDELRESEEKDHSCEIKDNCRWYKQEGNSVCLGCSRLATNITGNH
jgi:hypothetical protein